MNRASASYPAPQALFAISWLTMASGLLVTGQFNQDEAELIFETIENWD